jgi:hypothetical protein
MDHWALQKIMGNLGSAFEKADSQWDKYQVPPRKFTANSNKYNFSQYVSPLTTWKVAKTTAHQKLIFKVQKLEEAPI